MLSGFDGRKCRMNVDKTLFAQAMEFVPRKAFGCIIEPHQDDAEGARSVVQIGFAPRPSSTHLARIVKRHRGLPGGEPFQAASYWHCRGARTFHTFHTSRCVEPA